MSRRSGRRPDRSEQQEPAQSTTLSLWGEAGQPEDFDPEAATDPLRLAELSEMLAPAAAGDRQQQSPGTSGAVHEDPTVELQVATAEREHPTGELKLFRDAEPPLGPAVTPGATVTGPDATRPELPVPQPAGPETPAGQETAGGAALETEPAATAPGGPGLGAPRSPEGVEPQSGDPPAEPEYLVDRPERSSRALSEGAPETITHVGDQIGYPQEVVPSAGLPSAGLIARVSSGESTELPHWTDPPTGEVPRAFATPQAGEDDLQAWKLLGARGLHWRDDVNDWSDSPGVEDLVDEDEHSNGMPQEGTGDPFSFDEDFERLEHERTGRSSAGGQPDETRTEVEELEFVAAPDADGGDETRAVFMAGPNGPDEDEVVVEPDEGAPAYDDPDGGPVVSDPGTTTRTGRAGGNGSRRRPRRTGRGTLQPTMALAAASAGRTRATRPPFDVRAEGAAMGGEGRDVTAAVATGTLLVALLVVCYVLGAVALLVLSAVAIFGCALEAFSMFQQAGFRPATLLGLVGSAGVVAAAYWRGTEALPIVIAVVVCASLVWYMGRVVEARPVVNVAVTVLGFAWIGILGSFSGLLLAAHDGKHLFIGAVVPTVAADLLAWFAGSRLGSHPLAPSISPNKTWEGAVAGGIAAIIAGAVIGHQLSPWGGLRHGLELGLVIAVVAPIGDLVQSMLKRDLGVKDSGTLLPGHGGLLDRFDSLLFVLPATYFLAIALHLIV